MLGELCKADIYDPLSIFLPVVLLGQIITWYLQMSWLLHILIDVMNMDFEAHKTMDPHGPTVTWHPMWSRTAPDQKRLPHPSRKPGMMAHQWMTSFSIFIIEALCASPHCMVRSAVHFPHSLSDQQTITRPCRESPLLLQGKPQGFPQSDAS